MADINKQISMLLLASKVQFWSGYNYTDLNNISKFVCSHQQLILNHPCTCVLQLPETESGPWRTIKLETPSMEEAVGKTPTQQMVQSIPTWPQQLQGEMFFDQTSLQNLFAELFGLGGFAFLWKSEFLCEENKRCRHCLWNKATSKCAKSERNSKKQPGN